jgi:pimeloyl-ACP methyl ester carboxylesterase
MNNSLCAKNIVKSFFGFTLLMMLLGNIAMATDLAKEQRIADQTLEALFDGEPVWLQANNKFLGLVNNEVSTSITPPPKGSVVLLIHGSGQGPDTPFVIAPLRQLFAESGYPTLSIQMPVLSNDASYEDYVATFPDSSDRITAAISYLTQQQKNRITIVAHSLGSAMLIDWLAHVDVSATESVVSIVTLGLGANLSDAEIKEKVQIQQYYRKVFEKITMPFLDAYGENDNAPVLASAPFRQTAVNNTHVKSQQMILGGSDHFFTDMEGELVKLIVAWMQ